MRGRKPKPRHMHLADGTYRPDRHAGDHPEPADGAPPCPPFLRGTARKEWERIVPLLTAQKGLLTEQDQAALAVYCQARSDYSWAVYKIRREGRLIKTSSGSLRAHPAIKIGRDAAAEIRKFAAEFGLTPSARSRIRLEPTAREVDPEDEEMFG